MRRDGIEFQFSAEQVDDIFYAVDRFGVILPQTSSAMVA
jgi:hypothetical protein